MPEKSPAAYNIPPVLLNSSEAIYLGKLLQYSYHTGICSSEHLCQLHCLSCLSITLEVGLTPEIKLPVLCDVSVNVAHDL